MPGEMSKEATMESLSYRGNTGNTMGISTVGFRSEKRNPGEWQDSNYQKYYQSFVDRENSQKVRKDTQSMIKETEALTQKNQAQSTKKLKERLHDINFWKTELEREIQDVLDETDLLCAQKVRLENALMATEIPLHIATDNLNCRRRRYGVDLVEDDVELGLLKEVDIINKVQDLLKRTIEQSDKQIKLNRAAKESLEMDWSDKKEADEIDAVCANLRNGNTNKQFHAGVARFQEIQSTPESWAQNSHDNIVRAEHERMASQQLRQLIDNILVDTSRDMREQADIVEVAFQRRIEELIDAKAKLEDNLKKTCGEIAQQEKNIEDLRAAIKAKDDPLKVAQTRLYNRQSRPNVDLCRDPAQYNLIGEVQDISNSMDALTQELTMSENQLKDLMDTRMALEKEIQMKKNSIFIDKDKCVPHRDRYPTTLKLQGYQNNVALREAAIMIVDASIRIAGAQVGAFGRPIWLPATPGIVGDGQIAGCPPPGVLRSGRLAAVQLAAEEVVTLAVQPLLQLSEVQSLVLVDGVSELGQSARLRAAGPVGLGPVESRSCHQLVGGAVSGVLVAGRAQAAQRHAWRRPDVHGDLVGAVRHRLHSVAARIEQEQFALTGAISQQPEGLAAVCIAALDGAAQGVAQALHCSGEFPAHAVNSGYWSRRAVRVRIAAAKPAVAHRGEAIPMVRYQRLPRRTRRRDVVATVSAKSVAPIGGSVVAPLLASEHEDHHADQEGHGDQHADADTLVTFTSREPQLGCRLHSSLWSMQCPVCRQRNPGHGSGGENVLKADFGELCSPMPTSSLAERLRPGEGQTSAAQTARRGHQPDAHWLARPAVESRDGVVRAAELRLGHPAVT
uniref:Tektin n=1 Tax=Macrostomum lignano TaxID=282301 RepID=A0A1I8IVP9_9PLAT